MDRIISGRMCPGLSEADGDSLRTSGEGGRDEGERERMLCEKRGEGGEMVMMEENREGETGKGGRGGGEEGGRRCRWWPSGGGGRQVLRDREETLRPCPSHAMPGGRGMGCGLGEEGAALSS